MTLFDGIILLCILFSGIFALYRGLVRELLGITAWILAVLGALYGLIYVRPYFRKMIDNPTIADIIGVGTIALIILVICTLINAYITGKLRKSALSGLDRDLGFLFGLVRGVLLIVLIYFTVSLALSEKEFQKHQEKYAQKSFSIPLIQKTTVLLEKILPTSLIEKTKELNTKQENLLTLPENIKVPSPPNKEGNKEGNSPYNDKERKDLNALILEIEE